MIPDNSYGVSNVTYFEAAKDAAQQRIWTFYEAVNSYGVSNNIHAV